MKQLIQDLMCPRLRCRVATNFLSLESRTDQNVPDLGHRDHLRFDRSDLLCHLLLQKGRANQLLETWDGEAIARQRGLKRRRSTGSRLLLLNDPVELGLAYADAVLARIFLGDLLRDHLIHRMAGDLRGRYRRRGRELPLREVEQQSIGRHGNVVSIDDGGGITTGNDGGGGNGLRGLRLKRAHRCRGVALGGRAAAAGQNHEGASKGQPSKAGWMTEHTISLWKSRVARNKNPGASPQGARGH